MPAPYRLIIRLVVALMAVAAFAVAYLIALALEAPNLAKHDVSPRQMPPQQPRG